MLNDTKEEISSKAAESGPDTKEAEALAAALNHSAERVQTLWFSFLTVMLYLAIATGSTTDRMLFLKEPLKLPVLDISLPLVGFYFLTPFIFVVFHFYVLLNLVLLARTAKCFEDAVERAFPEDGEAREVFRMRIENTLFVQLLVGGRPERQGINAKLMSFVALVTLALFPLLLLWPGIGSAAVLAVLTPDALINSIGLFGDAPHLDLRGEELIDGERLARIEKNESTGDAPRWEPTLPLEERDLTRANLVAADIRHVDLRSAILNRADLTFAWVQNADLRAAYLQGATLVDAHLQGALFNFALLQGAFLDRAHLEGTSLINAPSRVRH